MNISIELDEPTTDERKRKQDILLRDLQSLADKNEDITPHLPRSWLLTSERALPFLEDALKKIQFAKFSYKFRVCDVEGAAVWHRSF
jgi:hypothetical protein